MQYLPANTKRLYLTIIVLVVFIGIFFRFFHLEFFATFGHDNSRDLILLYKMDKYGELIFRGPVFSIVWAHLSPIYYYILFPFYKVAGFHPLTPAIVSTFLNIGALVAIAFVSYKSFGQRASVFSTILYSFSFLVIQEGAFGLNPTFLPLFSVLTFFSLLKVFEEDSRYLILLAVCLVAMISFHPGGFFVIAVVFILFILYRPKMRWRHVLISLGIFGLMGILPYLIQEKKFNWWDVKKFLEYAQQGKETPHLPEVGVIGYIKNFFIVNSLSIGESFLPELYTIGLLVTLIVFIAIAYYAIKKTKPDEINPMRLLSQFILIYVLLFGIIVKFKEVGMHEAWFQAVLIPLIVLFLGVVLAKLSHKKIGAIIVVIFLLLFVITNLRAYFTYQPERDTFYSQKIIADAIRDDSEGRNIEIFGTDHQPIYYLLWYYEDSSEMKEKYYSWLKWDRGEQGEVVYYIEDKYELKDEFITSMAEEKGLSSMKEILEYNDRVLYKFERE